MIEKLKLYRDKIWKFCLIWNELMILPIMFVLLLGSTPFFRAISPTAGAFDLGVLQTVLVAGFAFAFGSAISWIAFKLNFPHLAKWLDDAMEKKLSNPSNTPIRDQFYFKKAIIGLSVLFGYFALYVLIVISLF